MRARTNCSTDRGERLFAAGLTLCIASLAGSMLSAAEPVTGRLEWKNGDGLAGQVVSANDEELVFRSDALAHEVTLDLSVLRAIKTSAVDDPITPPTSQPPDVFRVLCRNGMQLFGELHSISTEHIELSSPRHESFRLHRREVDSLLRSQFGASIDLVEGQRDGWKSIDPRWIDKPQRFADWDVSRHDRISTVMPGARLYLDTQLPDVCEIELSLKSEHWPAFSLALGDLKQLQKRTGSLEVETWGDELVVSSPGGQQMLQFERLGQFEAQAGMVDLRIFWNRQTGLVEVISPQMRHFRSDQMAPSKDLDSGGILLECKGADLTVTRLRVSSWRADQQVEHVPGQDRVRLLDDRKHFGILSGPDEQGRFAVTRDAAVEHVSANDMGEIIFPIAADYSRTTTPHNCELSFRDGTLLTGTLLSIAEGVLTLKTEVAAEPLTCRLEGLRECRFVSVPLPEEGAAEHLIEYAGMTLRGTLGEVDGQLGWRLTGSKTVVPLAMNEPLTIRRAPNKDKQRRRESDVDEDVLVLTGGDQLPCRVTAIDEEFLTLETSFSQTTRIPLARIQAVSFRAQGLENVSGFDDTGWQFFGRQPDQIEVTRDELQFRSEASASHPTLLKGGTLSFDIDWDRNAQQIVLMVNLMPRQERVQAAMQGMFFGRTHLAAYILCSRNVIRAMAIAGNGIRQLNAQKTPEKTGPVNIRLQTVDNEILLFLDGEEYGRFTVDRDIAGTLGVTLQVQSPRLANGVAAAPAAAPATEPFLKISNLTTGGAGGLFQDVMIDAQAREYAVTVPRMRRDRPQTHVLVGKNGDLLRGKLISLINGRVQFESRLDEVSLSTDQLAGIVWLKPAATKATAANAAVPPAPPVPVAVNEEGTGSSESGAAMRATFGSGVMLSFALERVEGDNLLTSHEILGPGRLNLKTLDRLEIGGTRGTAGQLTDHAEFSNWTLIHAPEPVIPGADSDSITFSRLVGQPAPDFRLPAVDGTEVTLASFSGKVVVLEFWATWCANCMAATPRVSRVAASFGDRVAFLAVNTEEGPVLVERFLASRDWNMPVVIDQDGAVARTFDVAGLPQLVVIDQEGIVRHVHYGNTPDMETALQAVIEDLLTGSNSEAAKQ